MGAAFRMTLPSFCLSANIIDGDGSSQQLASLLHQRGFTRPGIVCDEGVLSALPLIADLVASMHQDGATLIPYPEGEEPTYDLLDSVAAGLRSDGSLSGTDVWIGIGGGSAMDFAKGLAVLSRNHGPAIGYRGFPENINAPTPIIAVPTTTGTGSEVTFNASFIDAATKTKMGINHRGNYPVLAILDPLLPASAPISVLASSGCDALVHALESFMSPSATPHTRLFSVHSFRLIMASMPQLLAGSSDLSLWADMQWAAAFAMFALSNTSSGPTGALSYYLGTNFGVPHGIAGGAFIDKICRINHERGYHDYAELLASQEHSDTQRSADSERTVMAIEQLARQANVPESCREFGVTDADTPGFVAFSEQASGAFANNPVPLSRTDIQALISSRQERHARI